MIIARIHGGLGNQLFQYALGRNLALKNNAELKLDISFYAGQEKRAYLLNNFNIVENIVKKDDAEHFGKIQKKYTLPWLINIIDKKILYYKEKRFDFDSGVLKIKKTLYLDGYWQSEKYFKDSANIIRKEFTLKQEPSLKTKEWLATTKGCNSTSLHIRRGDYVTESKTKSVLGACPLEYYEQAVNLIVQKTKDPTFFIFSDDIKWVKENLKINHPIFFVSDDIIPDYEEMVIMSSCKNNIIANSSFSWWGAWLNDYQNKIIIAPKKWFQNQSTNTRDLIPSGWIEI